MADPRSPAAEDYPYQVDESLRQRLDLAHHLVEFGRQVILVRGPRGSGRSRFLRTLAAEAAGDWVPVLVGGASTGGDITVLLESWLEGLGMPGAEGASAVDSLRAALRRLVQQRRRCVLLIDDAEQLAGEVVKLIQAVAHAPDDFADTRVVLAVDADTEFAEAFDEAMGNVGLVHVIEIPPLDRDGVRGLAAAWATLIGLPGTVVLPDDAVDDVAAAAGGRPARVLELLASRLENGQPSEEEIFGRFDLPARVKRIGGIAIVVLAALGLVALALSHRRAAEDTPPPDAPTVIELDLPGTKPAQESAPAAVVADRADAVPATAGAGADRADDEDRSALELPAAAEPAPPVAAPGRTAVATPASPPAAPAVEVSPQDAAAQPPTVPESPERLPAASAPVAGSAPQLATSGNRAEAGEAPPTTSAAPAAPPKPGKQREEIQPYTTKWVLTQKAGAYVVQVFGSSTREAAEKFLHGHAALAGRAAIVELQRKGAPWYVVVWGLFADRDSAAAAIAALPAAVKGAGPWPRTVASLNE